MAVGPALLGFQPSESVVVVGLCGRRVAFCGRVDLADAQACTRDVLVAMRNSGADAVELVGYSQRAEWAALVLDGLARGPFDGAVIRQHVTDGATAWRCDRGELLDSEPFTPSLPQPECTRADTVAAVTAPRHPADANTVEARTAGASNSQRQGLLTAAMDSDELLGSRARSRRRGSTHPTRRTHPRITHRRHAQRTHVQQPRRLAPRQHDGLKPWTPIRRASRPATALLSSSTGSRPGSVWTASQKPLERCGG